MLALQTEVLEVASRWLILAGPHSISLQLHVDSLLLSTVDAQRPSSVLLQSDPDLSRLIADLKDAIKLPGWVGSVIKWSGLITMIIGIIAYFVSPSVNNRRRGFAMATTGIVLSIIGFAFPVFISLIDYVLSG